MEKQRKNTRRNNGITLIVLVITIVILLILAGISIAELTGKGIFAKANEAKQKYKEAEDLENQMLADYESQLNSLGKSTVGSGNGTGGEDGDNGGGEQHDEPTPSGPTTPATSMEDAKNEDMFEKTVNSKVQDEFGNQVVVPAGFRITKDAYNVTEGIVIIDQQENEFVWVPVGTIMYSSQSSHKITLSRYEFSKYSGTETDRGEQKIYISSLYYEEESSKTSSLKNAIAKNLEEFKKSVEDNHGYYIGRYEGRKDDSGSNVTEKSTDEVWSSVSQSKASTGCQAMYKDNSNFTTDLINSYAWDTAIVFIQTFSGNNEYSIEDSANESKLKKGTRDDEVCNIYDMASNVTEWTTETCTSENAPCTYRGGYYAYRNWYTGDRRASNEYGSSYSIGFRPILYINN